MKISLQKYAAALCESLMDEKDSLVVTQKIQNLLKLLNRRKQNKLIKQLPEVFKTQWLKRHNKVAVTAVLARAPLTEEINSITQLLTTTLKKEIILSTRINPQVIGGLKLEFENCIIDGTIAARLINLYRNITH